MSAVEKTIRKLPEAQQGGTEGTADAPPAKADGNSRPSSARAVAAEQCPLIVLDHAALRAAGLLPPKADKRRFAFQYRKIKRPLIAHAIGHGAERLPKGYLIMLASAMPGEGKTFTAMTLALSIAAEEDLSMLFVDARVPKPQLSRLFGLRDERVLLDVLRDPQLDVESVIRRTDVPSLSILPAGESSADATELLASKGMEEAAQRLGGRDGRRIVLFVNPPLIQTAECPTLVHAVRDRGRDAHCWTPPAQIPACAIYALGSHLGCLTANRLSGQG